MGYVNFDDIRIADWVRELSTRAAFLAVIEEALTFLIGSIS